MLEDHGYNPDAIFEEAGIDPEALAQAESRVDIERAVALAKKVDETLNDPCFGLKAAIYWHPSQLHALGYAWISSKTLRDALERLVRYGKILNEVLVHKLSENEGNLTVEVDFMFDLPPKIDQIFTTANLARLISMCRMNYGEKLNPLSVTFRHTSPPCAGEYFSLFKANVDFQADKDSITFAKNVLDKALIGHNPKIAECADQAALRYLANFDKTDIAHRVKVKIVEMLPSGDVTASTIAKKLYMSNRSFSRRLSEADTSFRELLEETRREMVSHYLKDENVDLREIPYLLGYRNYSSFFKAYKRWTGKTPTGMTH
jgi:AraC-like DNA-binding protein